MILVDTSVWIDFFAAKDLPHVNVLEQLILNDANLVLMGIVLTEILQGIANDAQHQKVQQYLQPIPRLDMNESIWLLAADIYRQQRKRGITIRKTNDCIISATALHYDCCLLHNDKDFRMIQRNYPLKTNCLALH